MHKFWKLLVNKLKNAGIDTSEVQGDSREEKSEDKTVGVAEFKYNNIYLRIYPQDDQGKLFSAEFFRDKMTRIPLTYVSPELLAEFITNQCEHSKAPDAVQHLYGKSLEPYQRTLADEGEDEITKEEINQAFEELSKEIEMANRKSGMKVPDTDEMMEWNQWNPKEEYRNNLMVKTFPKDSSPKIENGKTPEKKNVVKQNFKKDGMVNWAKGSRLQENTEIHGQPTRLQENCRNKVLIYVKDIGAVFVDKILYESHKRDTSTKWGLRNGEVVLLKEGQNSEGNFIPVCLRGLK